MKLTFRSKLLIPIISIVVIFTIIIQVLVYFKAKSVLENEIFSGMERNALTVSEDINSWFNSQLETFKNWSSIPQVHAVLAGDKSDPFYGKAKEFFTNIEKDFPFFNAVFLTNDKGKVLIGSNDEITGKDLSSRDYFKKIMENGESVISSPLISKSNGDKVSVIAYPLKKDGRVIGMLGGSIKLRELKELFTSKIKIGQKGYCYMIAPDGLFVLHPNEELEMKMSVSDTDFGKYMIENKKGIYKYWWPKDNAFKGQAFHEVPLTGWIVAITCPLNELLSGLNAVKYYSFIGTFIMIAAFFTFVYWFTGTISRLVNNFVALFADLAKGDLTKDISSQHKKRGDEFGEMAVGFQTMVDSQRERVKLAEAIADGDLSQNVELLSEHDMLGSALRKMTGKLKEVIGQISEAALQVSSGSGEVSDASQSLSQGATEQAASLEEISSSISEIASQTKANAESAVEAKNLSMATRDNAEKGSQDVTEMLGAMDDINESSKKIATIIKSIDDIAFQTNILALNAAVEAARAGVHGKGFAVVAEEVRTLAGRSAKAASETALLIETALQNAQKGQNVAQKTSDSFKSILESIVKFTDLTSEIAAASNEQANGVSQINVGLSQVDQVTQQNTAHAEETASVSEELASQAKLMSELLTYFKLNLSTGVGQPKPPSIAPPPFKSSFSTPASPPRAPKAALGGGWKDLRPYEKPSAKPVEKQETGNSPAQPSPKPPADKAAYDDIISLEDKNFGRY